jgi:hypothetical protein
MLHLLGKVHRGRPPARQPPLELFLVGEQGGLRYYGAPASDIETGQFLLVFQVDELPFYLMLAVSPMDERNSLLAIDTDQHAAVLSTHPFGFA